MDTTSPLNRLNARDIIVDFFGSLVPGIVFTSIASALFVDILFSLAGIIFLLSDSASFEFNIVTFVGALNSLVSAVRIEFFIFLIILSYIMGHIFYRQDLKFPDKASFKKIKPDLEKKEDFDGKKQIDNWVAKTDEEVEYPYANLKGYLESRGLKHLSRMVPWQREGVQQNGIKRTKFFNGILKIRLFYYRPEKCSTIARNEAHVRLSSTTWYLARTIRNLCTACLTISLLACAAAIYKDKIYFFPENLNFLLPPAGTGLLLFIMHRLRCTINNFFHYQRVREIICVLETAYALFREDPKLFEDIFPEYAQEIRQSKGSA